MKVEMEREWTISLLRCSNIMQKHEEEWAGEHFIFWASFLGPLRVNPPICINYTANSFGGTPKARQPLLLSLSVSLSVSPSVTLSRAYKWN